MDCSALRARDDAAIGTLALNDATWKLKSGATAKFSRQKHNEQGPSPARLRRAILFGL